MLLLIDNYDSFTYNLVHYLGELGARLLERWNLPESLIDAVAHHHSAPGQLDLLSLATQVSNLMADALWTPHASQVNEARRLLQHEFGLDMDGFITLAIDCKDVIRDAASLYQVHLPGKIDCQELLSAARAQYMEEAMEAAIDWDSLAEVAREGEMF